MKISELKNAPEWLVLANTTNADVEIHPDFGYVIWNGGELLGGEFRGGEFRGGEFRGGEFRGGKFLGGYFRGGEFLGGYFRDGYFLGGYFRGGYFLGGEFRGGEFRGGLMMPNCKWIYGQTHDGKIKIGCKLMSMQEWEEWFSGNEKFSTERGTKEFKKIQACFEATKAYLNFLNN